MTTELYFTTEKIKPNWKWYTRTVHG